MLYFIQYLDSPDKWYLFDNRKDFEAQLDDIREEYEEEYPEGNLIEVCSTEVIDADLNGITHLLDKAVH